MKGEKFWVRVLVNLTVVFLCLQGISPLQIEATRAYFVDEDLDGIADDREEKLLGRYAPLYYFHPEEEYFPSTVEQYLEHATLRFHYRGLHDDEILPVGGITSGTLASQSHRNKNLFGVYTDEWIRSDEARDVFLQGGYFLQIPSNEDQEQVYRGDVQLTRTKLYGHVFRDEQSKIRIQYWMFFPYNLAPSVAGVRLNHEGDWEHITIQLNEQEELETVAYASHNNEGKRYFRNELQFCDGRNTEKTHYSDTHTHPVVYVALGTHASFATSGEQKRGWYLPSDYTGEGSYLQTLRRVCNLGEREAPMPGADFIRYAGLWGEIGTNPISTGPKTPSFQAAWRSE